ncbi:gliding motility protein GldL [Olleya sp. HaHaR_3_96]|uniref:gliding motility protein GldL n=1 Tax=Olleya sp. HaHaR_3_96 TaxID=2745560 RepID=UPI001C50085F|nr:gliding motility protein GldL [Olleya sp. HaHaR_3_96]QXP61768.1 gliding motility protein GldL [Olleya sp. HaHaR_3_96]
MTLKQFKVPLLLLIVGIVLTIVGAAFKIQGKANGSMLLTLGTFTEFCAIFLGILKLIKVARHK